MNDNSIKAQGYKHDLLNWNADNGAGVPELDVRIQITQSSNKIFRLYVAGGAATRWHEGLACVISGKDANYIMHDAQSFNDCIPVLLKYTV